MKRNSRCCFAGHSLLYDNAVAEEVEKIAENLILRHNVDEFWVGNYGEFDRCAGGAIRKLKRRYPHISLTLVIPYLTEAINRYKELYDKSYDAVLVADIPPSVPKKFHIIKANEYMVDCSEFLICYIRHARGGAAKTFDYARKRNLRIFNVAKGT